MKILLEQTDEEHPLSVRELTEQLGLYGVAAERKALYTDIERLRDFGVNVETRKSGTVGYFVAERDFELAELKLLVDAVQSSRLITEKKSAALIKKLAALTSVHQARHLNRHVYVEGRPKSYNETVYYSVDALHAAINAEKQIRFRYFDYDTGKRRVYRKDGGKYQCTPVTLCWSGDNYYLIAYSAKHDGLAHYRVDRMNGVTILEEAADKFDRTRFNTAEHAKRVFGMYSGETVKATLSFDNSLVSVVLDQFGRNVGIRDTADGRFTISVEVSESPVFLGWMFQLGRRARILSPESLVAAMREALAAHTELYTE
ncbi:MAG: WYL domain-containing protein [Christensenellaceae bacterium]|jgi:predicted DNA-binding transcriptional regulator YafY|nr:WYL domain-containing protein [Christensenellaceae bacterium]